MKLEEARAFIKKAGEGLTVTPSVLARRIQGRADMNERTARVHPDPEVRLLAKTKSEAYDVALRDVIELEADEWLARKDILVRLTQLKPVI